VCVCVCVCVYVCVYSCECICVCLYICARYARCVCITIRIVLTHMQDKQYSVNDVGGEEDAHSDEDNDNSVFFMISRV
jgi:hypothetical protein